MSEDEKDVNASSAEFKQGVEAGLNSEEDTKNWKAGNELGRELKEEAEATEPVRTNPFSQFSPPLFMKDSTEGTRGNDQDEKDGTAE
jgi:hypothetical protein